MPFFDESGHILLQEAPKEETPVEKAAETAAAAKPLPKAKGKKGKQQKPVVSSFTE